MEKDRNERKLQAPSTSLRCRKMTESLNDINPTGDKLSSNELDDQTVVSDFEGDDDFFVCRKCNKVFKNLPEYLEHKIKDENYRISQMRSKVDRRMVLPQLVQKQKRQKKRRQKPNDIQDKEASDGDKQAQSNSYQPPTVDVNDQKSNVKSSEDRSLPNVKDGTRQESSNPEVTVKKGRKKNVTFNTSETATHLFSKDNRYVCSMCGKKFRREATLRWHVTYGHENKMGEAEESDSSENEQTREVIAERDEDFKVEMETKNAEIHNIEEGAEKNQQEIHIIIEQPNTERQLEAKGAQVQKKATESQKLVKQRMNKNTNELKEETSDRPYNCEICGRSFKELTVLKAHGVVHSDERKFICMEANCPYGFKTKGGLVRHMRRHTGERPYACEKCGRAFSESGALTRHLKARRNCSQTPDSAYPRYMKNWTYHPNIPAVIDPAQRDAQQGRSTVRRPPVELVEIAKVEEEAGEIHYLFTDSSDMVTAEIISPQISTVRGKNSGLMSSEMIVPQLGNGSGSSVDIKLDQDDTADAEEWNAETGEIQDSSEVINVASTEETGLAVKVNAVPLSQKDTGSQSQAESHYGTQVAEPESSVQASTGIDVTDDADLIEMKNNADVQLLKPTQCHVCKKDLEAVEGLEIHLRSHLADQPSRCGLCHFLSQDREELRQHILSMHHDSLNNIEASVLAMEEKEGGGGKGEAMQGRKSVLRDALLAVKQLYSLKKNKTSTDAEKPSPSTTGSLQCMVCNRFFRGSSYLRQHMRTHTGDRPHQCHLCHRSFTSRDILKKHMYVHKEQRDFKCGECGKLFKRMAHVQQHLRIHSQERSFRCAICDKLFKTQNSLKVHLRTHSGINPYKCHVCSRHFRERGSLQRHMRLHTGEKPYKCPLCNRAFAEQGTLSRHLKAKIPCSASRSSVNLESSEAKGSTVLAQFSTMVADTQQYILPEGESGQQYILPAVQDHDMGDDYVVLQTIGEGSEEVIENIEVVTEQGRAESVKPEIESAGEQAEGQDTETLQIYDSSTGESLIIVADKSIVDLVRDQQLSLESGEGGSSLEKIRDILLAANHGDMTTTTVTDLGLTTAQEQVETTTSVQGEVMQMQESLSEETIDDTQPEMTETMRREMTETTKEEAYNCDTDSEITATLQGCNKVGDQLSKNTSGKGD